MSENHFGTEDLFDVSAALAGSESDAVSEQMHEAFDRTGTKSVFTDFLSPQASVEEEPKTAKDPDEEYWEVHGGSVEEAVTASEEGLTATEKNILR